MGNFPVRPWGNPMAVHGEFYWPPMGNFWWPLTIPMRVLSDEAMYGSTRVFYMSQHGKYPNGYMPMV